ncbi:2-oxo acid dehydrogenase subunit E2 [Streptomyces argyrophyllae]|uniref:Dihydrolipoamide acetyltransferase component of pyruvate dehydrogenase complex n=1 Tax=Streptomyces argyrophylli TaxID=2726118 RepID=A0A6M4PIE1_9ACTN|nr:dihydrolipoamide acetyltransferase family protein [Streptomyces argyrophyllae]QJS10985.1 2-oxo acid dehydrogenase subunit E2 [Streptomyces argyrophyllae]
MAQVLEFKLPDLGEGLTEAEIVRWLVQVGDVVAVDQPVVEVETAKAMVEVPCPYGGVVTARFGEEGTELPVGAPLLTVAVGEREPEPEGSGNVLVGYGTQAPAARRRRVRATTGTVDGQGVRRAADGGGRATASGAPADGRAVRRGTARADAHAPARVAAPAVAQAPAFTADTPVSPVSAGTTPAAPVEGPVPVISPLVRKLARDNGVDLRRLTGSGPDGLILRADVENALRAEAAPVRTAGEPAAEEPAVRAPAAPLAQGGGTRIPLKGVRGAVADKLSRSRREIPDATCWVDADATELMRARTAMNAAGGPKISLLALLARICTAGLARFPELNSFVDTEAREVVRLDQVHLGFAAQTERGLVVPVVRDAHARDAESLTAEFARLTEAARTGTLTPGELTGGTFTLNNYGVFGVDGSTPIINHPEAAMLGVGRIVPKPWVHEGELAVRQVVQLSLTFDHRVCDGGTAGGFLRYVADRVEQPAVLLRTL